MNNSEGLKSFQQSLAGLPQWVSERILQQINQLTHYEPVIGIMGKSGAGKSSLCNALFASEVSPVSDVAACTREPLRFRLQVGDRYMTLMDLPGVGESGTRDTEYAALYREQLSRLDLVLWLIKADGVTAITPGMTSLWISVRPGSLTFTSMTVKRGLSLWT